MALGDLAFEETGKFAGNWKVMEGDDLPEVAKRRAGGVELFGRLRRNLQD